MGTAFLATMAMIIVLGFILSLIRSGDPDAYARLFGELSLAFGLIVALFMGRQHVRSLKTAKSTESTPAS
jgi:hypothetical protein